MVGKGKYYFVGVFVYHIVPQLQAQQLSVSQSNLTVGNLSDLFETIFSKSLDKVPVSEVFMEEWDEYRKVSCQPVGRRG